MAIYYFKKISKIFLLVVGVLILLAALFFFWLSYSSPVNEAGREFRKNVKSYENVEIETMDDVFERLDVLDSHYNTNMFDKVQGGEKREVTQSDLKTLFGEPHEVIEEVNMSYADTVYQYYYEDMTLNFHQYNQTVDEYVIENFTESFYDPNTLDQLFIEAIKNHQTQFDKESESFEPIPTENVPQSILDQKTTRKIWQNGWHTWPYNRQDYFDTGTGDYGPNEFLSLQYEEDDETELHITERRYRIADLEPDSPEEIENKKEITYTFRDYFDQKETNNADEKLRVVDFSNAFGEVTRMYYDFQKGELGISWLLNDEDYPEEITATVSLNDNQDISDLNDVAELEVNDFNTSILHDLDIVF